MILQLDDEFRITTDASKYNWQLEKLESVMDRKTKEEIKKEWQIIGWFGTNFGALLRKYKAVALIDSDFSEVNKILDKLDEVEETIINSVKQENIVLVSKSNE